MKFDTLSFLKDKFGTPTSLMSFLSAYKVDGVNIEAVTKWFQRRSVPGTWLPVLLAFMEIDSGEPVRLAPYLKEVA